MSVVLVEDAGPVRIITINRPRARNTIDHAVATGIGDALYELDERPDLRVGILTGVEGHFRAGMDLKVVARGTAGARARWTGVTCDARAEHGRRGGRRGRLDQLAVR